MDLWVEPSQENIAKANKALSEFGSPTLLEEDDPAQVVQIGVEPNRIDIIVTAGGLDFKTAWDRRIVSRYGDVKANWIDLDSLIQIKSSIDHPRHQEDVRVLKEVKKLREGKGF
jgi:hypothetical protein